ncbi:hypothetical protein Kpol_461p10 [Vanderwaltozyma polyspora DSM 70294]|uniref:Uncharacterized protein n=1 Tax=Vanderwaltozyma polyspora (strain ATCC 22028 / DSM 70294 / BCRC 21397 / CBS 2163 / NBRC 10782 / NRRL Y-8283 / UCD 57-17) TaxID=436907 RepID=A7TR46_VANPO|nr:uncharacterized protein Kpol_461p10 [Vanderwaltozyma polyspora DSM 70294]EDO15256.1 hypothetical protein Kpol_461p10 [Vanderwaltozyma polyspora DSM 70294]
MRGIEYDNGQRRVGGRSGELHRKALSDVTSQVSNKVYGGGNTWKSSGNSFKNGAAKPSGGASAAVDDTGYGFFGPGGDDLVVEEDSLTEDEGLDRLYSRNILERQQIIDLDTYAEIVDDDLESVDDQLSDKFEGQIDEDEVNEDEDEEDDFAETANREPLSPMHNEEIQETLDAAFKECYRDTPDPMDDDTYDVVMVSELSNDIFKYLRELEQRYKPNPYYMSSQSELKWSYRSTLIDWIVQVHARFQLLPETLYLTVNIIDRFLSKKTVTLNRFQLVGAAALFLAAKYEEINCPTLKDIVYMLDNAYTKDEIIKAERFMIETLDFEIGWPGPMSFLRRISKADDYEYDIRTLAKYLLEITIMDSRLVAAPPSWLASGAYFLSKIILGYSDWTIQHVYYSGYTQEQIFPLATTILENCRDASTKHEAIWKKYSERRQHRSAHIVAKWITLAERKIEQSA